MPTGPHGDLELQSLGEDISTTGYKSKVKFLLLYDEIFLNVSSQFTICLYKKFLMHVVYM